MLKQRFACRGRPSQQTRPFLPNAGAFAPHPSRAASQTLAEPVLHSGDVYEQLAHAAGATVATAVGTTQLGRGLIVSRDIDSSRQPLVSVPVQNALVIADDPVGSISIYSDRAHRRWQEVNGELPQLLLEFLQGDARWDIRMAAWLLYVKQMAAQPGSLPLWQAYLGLLPQEQDMCCLLNYSRAEAAELQLPGLVAEAAVQADWAAYLHGKYLHYKSGSLAPLRLSGSLAESLWAISMVRSRTFSEDMAGECLTLMVPYADLANHSFDNNSTFCMARDAKSFQLQSLRPLAAGEELTISYGATKPNAECLRDYGFVVPGNPCDRVHFTRSGEASSSSSSSSSSTIDEEDPLPRLNPVSLLLALSFTGDLSDGDIQPQQHASPLTAEQQLRLARRRSALLSMPIASPPAAASGRNSSSSSSSSSGGGLFGWMDAATQPWTPTGRPDAEPLSAKQVPQERAAVQQLQQLLLQQLSPRSNGCDEQTAVHQGGSRCTAGCALDGIPEQQGLEGRSSDAADGSGAPAQ
ncbi:hypothetical protein OEZ85_000708 [Tetradesmus obliquus]|uniref:SET domain-containing protein n=1 Tax=Tetradesmus obliquus TaxID=3088 RepID=A0ABY8UIZ9_TETOB|nr:hypothetical protein OEZ85_000708 [Tetradesmus obliquus]